MSKLAAMAIIIPAHIEANQGRLAGRSRTVHRPRNPTPDISDTPGPFGLWAVPLFELGLYPIPTGGDDGKKPLVEWEWWTRPGNRLPGIKCYLRWQADFANANIGILLPFGRWKLLCVDCDSPEMVRLAMEVCGPTPLIEWTPRGGGREGWQ